ncbi:MAG TPA: HTTM domain-containing protein [Thermoanaerobaculia bacterium]
MSRLARHNPFACAGSEMPPNALLLAKLIALCLLLKGYFSAIVPAFLPFLPILEYNPTALQQILQVAFVISIPALLFNIAPRSAALTLGLVMLLAIAASKPGYLNATVYTGCILLLAGLQSRTGTIWLLRAQIALLYLGAAINKIFEADWWTGVYVENWLVAILTNPYYETLTSFFPPMALSRMLGWTAIAVELFVGVAVLSRAGRPAAIWIAAVFHIGVLLMTHQDFGIFLTAIFASFLALIDWPASVRASIGDRHVLSRLTHAVGKRLDVDRIVRWEPAADRDEGLTLDTGRSSLQGGEAFARLLLLFPPVYFALALLLTGPKWVRWWSALLALLLFTPWMTMSRVAASDRSRGSERERAQTPG